MLSGPIFEKDSDLFKSAFKKEGAHYNIFSVPKGKEMEALRCIFPEGQCDEMNFILFSTSGVHGSYLTIEDIEGSLKKYGEEYDGDAEDYSSPYLTGLIIQPRLVCMRYFGEMKVALEDIPYLKKLRQSSFEQILKIGV